MSKEVEQLKRVLAEKVLEVGFFQRCFAQNRGSTPGQRKQWREGIYDQIREVMPVQGRLSRERMCELAQVSRAGFYRSLQEREPVTEEMEVRSAIQQIALEHRRRYGYRRVAAELRRRGMQVNHKRVVRMMREDNLLAVPPRPFMVTTDANHGLKVYLNLARRLKLSGINQLWVADITYIRLGCEFVYLALVLDVFSRKVVGWALGRKLASGLAVAAFEEAIAEREPPPGLVHHSDRGVQYACREYVALLEKQQMIPSMSRPGNPYDNANCESFIKTLKREEIYAHRYMDLEQLRSRWASLSSSITTGSGCIRRWATALRKSLKNRTHNPPGRLESATIEFSISSARATTELLGIGDSNAVPFPRPQPPAGDHL